MCVRHAGVRMPMVPLSAQDKYVQQSFVKKVTPLLTMMTNVVLFVVSAESNEQY